MPDNVINKNIYKDHTLEYIPGLDGIRGIAILFVIIFHLWEHGFTSSLPTPTSFFSQMGWFGVDLFFVLSGYLITTTLLNIKDSPKYFKSFLARRFLRILPVYYLFLLTLFTIVSITPIGSLTYFQWLIKNQIWLWLFLQNMYVALTGIPFPGVNHLWILSVELQFYLVWPLVVYYSSRKRLMHVALFMILLSLVTRVVVILFSQDWHFTYFSTICRMDSLAFGSLAAIFLMERDRFKLLFKWINIFFALSVISLISIIILQGGLQFKGLLTNTVGFTFMGIIFATFIMKLVSGTINTGVSRLCESSCLIFLGKISYSLYIVHYPWLFFLSYYVLEVTNLKTFFCSSSIGNVFFIACYIITSISIAFISWYFIERRFLRLKEFFKY